MSCKLTCTCGEPIHVELTDAGQKLTCSCGRLVEVPSYSALLKISETQPSLGQEAIIPDRTAGRITVGLLGAVLLILEIIGDRRNPDGDTFFLLIRMAIITGLITMTIAGKIWPRIVLIVLLIPVIIHLCLMGNALQSPVFFLIAGGVFVVILILMFVKT